MTSTLFGRRIALGGIAAGGLVPAGLVSIGLAPRHGRAQTAAPIRIGVLTDENGPYADSAGSGSVLAAQMAAADFGGTVLGQKIEIVHADTQNKPDIASAIARRWYGAEDVDMITDLPVTPIAAAVQQIAAQQKKTVIITAAAASEFTSKSCGPTSIHWADDTHALAAGTAGQVVAHNGKTWFFITVDFSFGLALQREATAVIEAGGGRVLGESRYPIGNTDFSSQLLAARASNAQVIGLASVGNDLVNCIKQAGEFGVTGRQTLAGFLIYITDIHALTPKVAQGFTFASGFYWDQNDASRAFSRRFFATHKAMPTRDQAAIYSASLHFLKAMQQAGTRDALAVNKAMRGLSIDYFGHPAGIRADGRALYDLTLYKVKKPEQVAAPWDYYEPIGTVAKADAFLPMTAACG